MFQADGRLVLSASDLNSHLECEHLTHLDLAVATKVLELDATRTDSSELVARKGDEFELNYLAALREAGRDVVEIEKGDGRDDIPAAVDQTLAALSDGPEIIYQATFYDGKRLGYADFLERVERPSALGPYSYEVADTKLARRVKPYFLLQLCFYSDLLEAVQKLRPNEMHVVLGTNERESFLVDDFFHYYRRLSGHLEEVIAAGLDGDGLRDTYPHPVEHCPLCRWSEHCDARRADDDHLSLVARMGRPQVVRLNETGISKVAQLATSTSEDRPTRVGAHTFERLQAQARLQVSQRQTGEHSYELLEPEEGRGFAQLPARSEGDIFFDIEGDPFYENGLEYLFGVTTIETGEPVFQPFWGPDRAAEKRAFEQLIDFFIERLERYPDLHIYHYAHYEPTALKRLMNQHATREDEVDHLLRNEVLVDLYRVVEQGLRISQPSYSIKKVEAFYMPQREAGLTEGGDSIVRFEEWLDSDPKDDSILEEIRRYNEEDCLSTYLLRGWLLERRGEAIAEFGADIPWYEHEEKEGPSEEIRAEIAALRDQLLAGVPDDPDERSDDQRARWLMAQLVEYHRREAKPAYWEYFDRQKRSEDELIEADNESIGGLRATSAEPAPIKQSLLHVLAFPPQEHKIGPGVWWKDPFSGKDVTVASVDDQRGELVVRRGKPRRDEPLPQAIIPGEPFRTTQQRKALQALGDAVVTDDVDGIGPWRAPRDLLTGAPPRTTARLSNGDLQDGPFQLLRAADVVTGLDDSYLFIQGPPGSGKTYTGAKLILELLGSGKRVGVCCTSHKAINKLLAEIERFAQPDAFHGLKKSSAEDPSSYFESRFDPPLIENSTENPDFPPPPETQLIAGTAWLWAREAMRADDAVVDYLFVDEAGQMALADALAISMAARNVVLLGDPLQLAQVSQGTHPEGSGGSVLEHLLGDDVTIPEDRGLFIDHTRRMHPAVCSFISEAVYDGRLESIAECERQSVACEGLPGAGLRYIAVEHEGNSGQSLEEADAIAAEIERLRDARYTLLDGTVRELRLDDIMVVTPYNAQVRCLRAKLPADVQIGTVDKFQGQEAAVVFFSMATSSGAEIPRNVEFLYSRNRLNVAISRARCLAILVASPKLLTIRCRSAEQLRLLNALCQFVEMAEVSGE